METCSSTCTDKNQPRSVKEEPRSPSATQPLCPESWYGGASSVLCECQPSSAPSGSTPTPLVTWALVVSYNSSELLTHHCVWKVLMAASATAPWQLRQCHSSSQRVPFACRCSAQGNPNDNVLERAPQSHPLNSLRAQPEQARWLRLLCLLLQ